MRNGGSYFCSTGGNIAAGRILRPAWLLARTVGQIEEIPGTALSTSGAAFVWPGGQRPSGDDAYVVNAWGGWARRGTDIYETGGGHSNGNTPQIHRLRLANPVPVWDRVADPSPFAQTVAYLNNEVGNCAHWNDDGKPGGSHVYWAMQIIGNKLIRPHYFNYDGITKPGYQTFAPNNEAWLPIFNIDTNTWDPPNSHALMPNWGLDAKGDGSVAFSPCCTDGTYYYAHILNKALGYYCLNKYDPVADTWTGLAPLTPYTTAKTPAGQDTFPGSIYDSARHELVVICEGVEQAVRRYNLTTGALTITNRTGIQMGLGWSSSYSGVAYDSKRDLYYVYSGKADTDRMVYVIDPKNNYNTYEMGDIGFAPQVVVPGGLNSRFAYIAEYDCLLMQGGFASNLMCLRLS